MLNIWSIILSSDPSKYNHAARKNYVDNTIDKSSLLRVDPDQKIKLDEQDSNNSNSTLTSPETIKKHLPNHMFIGYMKILEVYEI